MLMQAAQQGDADALAFIARCFMGEEYVWSGAGFTTDDANASKLMQKSALLGSATGVLCAARSGNLTPSVKRDMPFGSFKEAFEEILSQAEGGNAFCCYMIANVYYWGDYLLVEPELAAQFKSIEKYNAWAYPIAGEWYERSFDGRICAGWGNYCEIRESGMCNIPQDTFESYYQMLADISPVICNNYGYYLKSVKNNPQAGLAYYAKAAYAGDPQGAYNTGHIYECGEIVEENMETAYRFYLMAANGGHPAGQFEMGYYHFEGCGGAEQDYAQAADWFEKAYENPKCSENTRTHTAAYLGLCYQGGLGVVQDYDVALEYLLEAKENIDRLWEPLDGTVLNAIGMAYAYGLGTEADIELAYQYFNDAANLGSEEAKEHLLHISSPELRPEPQAKGEENIHPFYQSLAENIKDAAEKDLRQIIEQTGDERIYTAALVTDRDCCSLFLAVNTVEYLTCDDDEPDCESTWYPDEWGYTDGAGSELSKLSALLWQYHEYLPGEGFFFDALISAMKQLKESGIFGKHADEITFFVSISDDEDAENFEDFSATQLNTPEQAATFLSRHDSD